MEQPTGNSKKIVIAALIVLVLILGVIGIVSQLLKKSSSTKLNLTPTLTAQPSITPASVGNQPMGNTVQDIKIAPTLLTPIPLPKTLELLKTDLAMTMKYKTISVRYSAVRDTYIVYYSTTIFDAQKVLGELLGEYGVSDVNSVKTEYIDNHAPLQERPPSK